MDEFLLHHVWRSQTFNLRDLLTSSGESIVVFNTGQPNTNAGPDFFDAKLSLDGLTWIGHVEIHINASDWYRHKHHEDPKYDSVILHVVWDEDKTVYNRTGERIPTLCLKHRVDPDILLSYKRLLVAPYEIPCANSIHLFPSISKTDMLQKTLVERLQRKGQAALEVLEEANGDWHLTTYILLARAFGGNLNQNCFERTVKSLPSSTLHKLLEQPKRIEALLFGQAGFLDELKDDYQRCLKEEYDYLRKAYQLAPVCRISHWNFHRLRPANFPSMRLAQFAAFVNHTPSFYDLLIHADNLDDVMSSLAISLHGYWLEHYDFGKTHSKRTKALGKAMRYLIVINAVIPVLVASSLHFDNSRLMDKALRWLEKITPENNKIIRRFQELNVPIENAGESQGAIELYTRYCQKKRCLSCNIGAGLLKKTP